jgi:hypothetical protein
MNRYVILILFCLWIASCAKDDSSDINSRQADEEQALAEQKYLERSMKANAVMCFSAPRREVLTTRLCVE